SRARLWPDGCTAPVTQRPTTDLSTLRSAASRARLIDRRFSASSSFLPKLSVIRPPHPEPVGRVRTRNARGGLSIAHHVGAKGRFGSARTHGIVERWPGPHLRQDRSPW